MLIIEHSELDAELIKRALGADFVVECQVVGTLEEFQNALLAGPWDVILSDFNLPGWSGADALLYLHETGLDIPFIIVTGTLGEERAAECFRMGATDYVLKHRLDLIPVAVARALKESGLRKRTAAAEERLRVALESYRTLVENAPYGICRTSVESDRFLAVNNAFVNMLGYNSVEEVLALRISEDVYVNPNLRSSFIGKLAVGEPFVDTEHELRHKSGGTVTVRASGRLLRDPSTGGTCFEAFVEDITAAKKTAEELRRSEERYRLLFMDSPLPMWIYEPETLQFLAVNHAAEQLYGYSSEEFRSLTIKDIRPPEDVPVLLEFLAQHPEKPRLWRHRRKDGTILDVDIHEHRFPELGALVLINDVTERLAVERLFRQAQKMEAIGRLAGGIAHDFNNLLMIINSYSQLVISRAESDAVVSKYAHQIIEAGKRAAELTQQLLLFSRKQVLVPSVIETNKAIAALGKMLPRVIGEDVQMRLELSPDTGRVRLGRGLLDQVIMNLVVNARDAMPKGGRLNIESSNVYLREDYAGSHGGEVTPGWYVRITFTDTGIGMNAETRNRIFEPFFTTKERGKGTGLGLATVYGIIKQAGGFIWVYTEVDHGTTFKIYLPRADEAATPERVLPPVEPSRGSELILIVEDEASLRSAAREYLEMQGYRVLEASDGVDALAVCRAQTEPIKVIITDIVMPIMNGPEMAAKATKVHPNAKVICMSGYTDRSVNPSELPECNLFLQKPFDLEALARSIRAVLETPSPSTAVGQE
jgi:two-component system, cell cycle sensor histidine kinase and response regulator CckA